MLITSSSTPRVGADDSGFAFLKPNEDRRGMDPLPPNAGTCCRERLQKARRPAGAGPRVLLYVSSLRVDTDDRAADLTNPVAVADPAEVLRAGGQPAPGDGDVGRAADRRRRRARRYGHVPLSRARDEPAEERVDRARTVRLPAVRVQLVRARCWSLNVDPLGARGAGAEADEGESAPRADAVQVEIDVVVAVGELVEQPEP